MDLETEAKDARSCRTLQTLLRTFEQTKNCPIAPPKVLPWTETTKRAVSQCVSDLYPMPVLRRSPSASIRKSTVVKPRPEWRDKDLTLYEDIDVMRSLVYLHPKRAVRTMLEVKVKPQKEAERLIPFAEVSENGLIRHGVSQWHKESRRFSGTREKATSPGPVYYPTVSDTVRAPQFVLYRSHRKTNPMMGPTSLPSSKKFFFMGQINKKDL